MNTTEEERAAAAAMRTRDAGGADAVDCSQFPPVAIDVPGTQKYVLIQLSTDPLQYLVRGNCDAQYHKDAAEPTLDQLDAAGVGYDVLGGGRIQADASRIKIYGHSYGFPWQGDPRHDIAGARMSCLFLHSPFDGRTIFSTACVRGSRYRAIVFVL